MISWWREYWQSLTKNNFDQAIEYSEQLIITYDIYYPILSSDYILIKCISATEQPLCANFGV